MKSKSAEDLLTAAQCKLDQTRHTVIKLACTQTLLYSSFRKHRKPRSLKSSATFLDEYFQKKDSLLMSTYVLYFSFSRSVFVLARSFRNSSPIPTPLPLRSINPPRFLFFITRARRKIVEGL